MNLLPLDGLVMLSLPQINEPSWEIQHRFPVIMLMSWHNHQQAHLVYKDGSEAACCSCKHQYYRISQDTRMRDGRRRHQESSPIFLQAESRCSQPPMLRFDHHVFNEALPEDYAPSRVLQNAQTLTWSRQKSRGWQGRRALCSVWSVRARAVVFVPLKEMTNH